MKAGGELQLLQLQADPAAPQQLLSIRLQLQELSGADCQTLLQENESFS